MLASVQQSHFYFYYSFTLSICKIRRSLLNCVLFYKTLTECTRRGRYTQRLKIYYMNESFSMLKNRHRNSFRTSVTFCSQQPSRCVPNIPYFSFQTPDQSSFRTSGYFHGCTKEQGRKRIHPSQVTLVVEIKIKKYSSYD